MPRWFHSPEPVPWLATLAEALRSGRRVVIDHQRGRGEGGRQRPVGPLGLVNKAGLWYLVAAAPQGRTSVFRVGRIHSAEVLDERFERPAGFDLVAFWKAWSEEFTSSRPRLEVALRASPIALGIFPEVLGDAARAALARAEPADEEGWRRMTLTFESVEAATHRLSGFGDLIEVVSPPEVRRHLLGTAEAVVRRYRVSADC
jgi:predicted DNA-binding transcriptional regulator YafY